MYCYIAVQYINIVSFFSYKLQISSVLARTRGTIYMYTLVWYDCTCTYQYNCAKLSVINSRCVGGGLQYLVCMCVLTKNAKIWC